MAIDSWIVVAGEAGIAHLIGCARTLGGRVGVIAAGSRDLAEQIAAGDVDEVAWFPTTDARPAEAFAQEVGAFARRTPRALLGGRHGPERVLLAAAAAALDAPVFAGVDDVGEQDGALTVRHQVAGGAAEETVAVDGPAALVLDGGGVPQPQGEPAPIEEVDAGPGGIQVIESHGGGAEVDLGSAKRVVGVGRGLKRKEDLHLVTELAAALHGDVACTRPLAEGLEWLPRDLYLGISGQHIAPRLYIAVGVSGQLQHMDGVHGAQTIVEINTDPKAPIVKESDYVLAGDLYALVPALTAALS